MSFEKPLKPTMKFQNKYRPKKFCFERTKSLSVRRSTSVSKLINSVARPNYRPIKHSLPVWETKRLNEKIPMFHGYGPEGPLVFHTGLLGHNPLKSEFKLNFSLNDPHYAHEYNPLHDPHLTHWVTSDKNRKFIHRQGLITDDMEVICTLKEFNEYRRLLWPQHKELINRQAKHKEEQKREQLKIRIAEQNYKKVLSKKLKRIQYLTKLQNKPQEVPKSTTKFKPKCHETIKKSNTKLKKIESYTKFALRKSGVIDQDKYQGTFIKRFPNDFYLVELFSEFFPPTKS